MVLSPENRVIQYKERLSSYPFIGYRYYDTPDGTDLGRKVLYTAKIAAGIGTLFGLCEIYGTEQIPKGNLKKFFILGKYIGPLVGIATTFTVTTYCSTILRKKDDEINHLIGGWASGAVAGTVIGGGPSTGIVVGFCLGAFFYWRKTLQMKGGRLFPEFPVRNSFSSYFKRNWDYTLLPDDIKGNWTRESPTDK